MIKTPMTVPTSMPPAPVVPMVRFPIAPAPVATTNGSRPAMKAKEVIWIGRKRSFAPSTAASCRDTPSSRRWTANSTIRIAFLPSRPTSMTRPIWAYTSLARPMARRKKKEPKTPTGSDRTTASGRMKLSYCMKKKDPIKDTGTARVGISVERQSPRNTKTTRATSTKFSG